MLVMRVAQNWFLTYEVNYEENTIFNYFYGYACMLLGT